MPAVDSLIGAALAPSPYAEARAEVDRLRVEIEAEKDRLREEVWRLREALRWHVVMKKTGECWECRSQWTLGGDERHAPGCLASKGEDK